MTVLTTSPTGIDAGQVLEGVLRGMAEGLDPHAPWLAALAVLVVALRCPMPERGPGLLARRDP